RLRRLSSKRVARPVRAPQRPRREPAASIAQSGRALGTGAPTAGPRALERILGGLSADLPVPVLVVQHMAPGFVEGFAKWLDRKLPIAVRLAAHRARARPGGWVAPDG